MPGMGAPHRRNSDRVPRNRKPVVHCGADLATLDRRLAGAMVAGHQQDDAVPRFAGPIKGDVDRPPGAVKVEAVEIDDPVRPDRAGAELAVPGSVQRSRSPRRRRIGGPARRPGLPGRSRRRPRRRFRGLASNGRLRRRIARQRPDRRRDPSPELGLLRAEEARHSAAAPGPPRFPWERGSAPRRMTPCRPRSAWPRRPRPRRCRSGSGP